MHCHLRDGSERVVRPPSGIGLCSVARRHAQAFERCRRGSVDDRSATREGSDRGNSVNRSPRSRRRSRWTSDRDGDGVAAAVLTAALGACGGDDGGVPTLTWWINPDPNPPEGFEGAFGQAGIAERCSTDQYKIEIRAAARAAATEQRIQLARRLAAEDSSIDLMSLDPVVHGGVRRRPSSSNHFPPTCRSALSEGVLQGAIDGATWDGQLVVAPLWANTQVLWYRKSLAEAAGLDMTQPVTWDQIIQGMSEVGATVGVQAQQVRGLRGVDQRLDRGRRWPHPRRTKGEDAKVELDSDAGRDAAARHQRAGPFVRRPARPLGVQRRHGARSVRRAIRERSSSTGRSSTTTSATGPGARRHRLGALPADGGRRGVTATHRRHQRGRRCVQLAHRRGLGRGGVHHLRGAADHLRRRHGEHAGEVGRPTRIRG